ncbi:MAG: hypothetical protein LBE79_08185 [Tannerella sp.]|jgi:hypothetical protein|nr:hypothetical protein [Tannerella sp.]
MYPKELMTNVYWGFFGGKYETLESFNRAMSEYNEEFSIKWNPNEIVLKSMFTTILYSYWDYDLEAEIENSFDLDANNQDGFTAGELLFKVHNQIVEKLENEIHHFFEGFVLGNRKNHKNRYRPLYFINQGR